MGEHVTVGLLVEHPEAVPVLAEWFEEEWEPYYGEGGPGDAAEDLLASANEDTLPTALVAFWDGELCGTAVLATESVTTHPHLTPWLAALLVHPRFRGRGVCETLVAAVEDEARQQGAPCIYTGVADHDRWLSAMDWEFVEKGPYFLGEVLIFRKDL